MSNPEITNNDTTQIPVFNPEFKDATLVFDGADTWLKGTVLGLRKIAAGSVVDGTNTGNGTVTGLALGPGGPPKVGDYNLECTFVVANGGVFKLEDPDGNLVADNLTLRVGAGLLTTFNIAGLTFIVTDGSTDFIAGDSFALGVTAVNKWVYYDSSAVDGSEIPTAILPREEVATGAGDVLRRILIGGEVNEGLLVFDQGETISETIREQLRNFGIILRSARSVDSLDNQ